MLSNKLNDILNTTYTNDIYHTICHFIKSHIDDIPNLSIDEVAKQCYVSKSMVSKFIKKLGYESYKDFKEDCEIYIASLKDKEPFITETFSSVVQGANELANDIIHGLENGKSLLDNDLINKISIDLSNCSNVIAIGHGLSREFCGILQYYLDFLGIPVMVSDSDFERQAMMNDNTLIIVISAQGNLFRYNNHLVQRINKCKQKKWLLTTNPSANGMSNTICVPCDNATISEFIILYILKVICNEVNNQRGKVSEL